MKRNKRMHILLVQQSPAIGGAEMYMLNLIREWTHSHDTVSGLVYGAEFSQALEKYATSVKDIPIRFDIIGNYRGLVKSLVLSPIIIWDALQKIKALHKRKPIDVILVSGFNDKVTATFLAILLRIPIVWIEYGQLGPVMHKHVRIPALLYRLLSRIPRVVVTPSASTVQSLIKDGHIPQERIHVVPCGVRIPRTFKHTRSKKYFTIGCVSRLEPEKGQENLIRAMPEIIKAIPKARCFVVGEGSDWERLRTLSNRLNVDKHIVFTGFVEDLNSYYKKMDVLVFPTTWELEGFGLVAVEAMARKIPVVASDVGSVREIVEGVGTLVKPGQHTAISKAVIHLFQNSIITKKRVEKAYTKVQTTYNIDVQAEKMRRMLF